MYDKNAASAACMVDKDFLELEIFIVVHSVF